MSPLSVFYIQIHFQTPSSILKGYQEKFFILLGNIASEGVHFRTQIFTQLDDILDYMASNLTQDDSSLGEKMLWFLSAAMRDEPVPSK